MPGSARKAQTRQTTEGKKMKEGNSFSAKEKDQEKEPKIQSLAHLGALFPLH